jgi:hypothetical protein
MWVVDNQTPFAAERAWVRDINGAEVWLVAVRGTFDILPDGSTIPAAEQEPVVLAPEFSGDPLASALLNDTDLPHLKHATDVLITGHAHAPGGKPARQVLVGLRLGSIKKVLQVTGDRFWRASLTGGVSISEPEPFTVMPMVYERSFGGRDLFGDDPEQHDWDARNPAGRGFARRADHLLDKPVPNVEYPSALLTGWKQRPPVAGFGPIAGHWKPRTDYTGTYDDAWEKKRQPLLPFDFDERYYQCAPHDQQVPGFVRGGETVDLRNVTPDGHLSFRLPRLSLAFTTYFDDGTSVDHRAAIHTVNIKPDLREVVVVWHTHLSCHHKVLKLDRTSVRLKDRIMPADMADTTESVE